MKHAPLQTSKLLFSVVLYRKPNAEVASEWRVLDICYASRRDQPILPERNTKTPPGVNHTPNGALEEAECRTNDFDLLLHSAYSGEVHKSDRAACGRIPSLLSGG